MKRKIYTVLLLLLLLIPGGVFAKEKTNTKYRFYYPERIYSDTFYKKGENNPEYPFMGDAWHYSEEIKNSEKKPDETKTKIIEEIPVIKYQNMQKVRYVILKDLKSNARFNLQEIEIFEKDRKIEYKVDCPNCSSDFLSRIQNTICVLEYNYISNGTILTLDLKEEYFPDDLTVKIHFGLSDGTTGTFTVIANNTKKTTDTYYQYKVTKELNKPLNHQQALKEVRQEERVENEIHEIKGMEEIENAKILERRTEYKYKDKLYQYYKEVRHYVDGYHEELKGLIKDTEDFIEVEPEKEPDPIIIKEYIEKEVFVPTTITEYVEKEIPTTITEYIEKEVLVPTEVTKFLEKKVPIIKESIKYQDKIIEKEVPIEKERIIEKVIEKEQRRNYPVQYISYLLAAVFLKKMSFFKG